MTKTNLRKYLMKNLEVEINYSQYYVVIKLHGVAIEYRDWKKEMTNTQFKRDLIKYYFWTFKNDLEECKDYTNKINEGIAKGAQNG